MLEAVTEIAKGKLKSGLATPLRIGDLVLLRNSSIEKSHNKKHGRKLDIRWIGPYRIREVRDNGSYLLAELDGTELRGSVAGNRLKRFCVRSEGLGIVGEQRDEDEASWTGSRPSAELGDAGDEGDEGDEGDLEEPP